MDDLDDERVMREFLLGTLDAGEEERVTARLASDREYFDAMTAFEDDLILRSNRGELSAGEQAQFDRAYTSSARRARVEASLLLLEVAREERHNARAQGAWGRFAPWLTRPSRVPRVARLVATATVVLAAAAALYLAAERSRVRNIGREVVVAATLTASGEKGPGPTPALDRIRIPEDASALQLVVAISPIGAGERVEAEIESLEGSAIVRPAPPRVASTAAGATVTVTVAPSVLADGDYVLRLRSAGDRRAVVATRAFRISRSDAAPAR